MSLNPAPSGGGIVDFSVDNATQPEWNTAGKLRADKYRLTIDVGAGSSGSSPGDPLSYGESASASFNFAVGSATAIPLPPAVWNGLATLALMGVASILRSRSLHHV